MIIQYQFLESWIMCILGQIKIRYPLILVGIYFIMSEFISKIEIAVKF